MSETKPRSDAWWVAKPCLLAALFFVLYHAVGKTYLGGYALMMGSYRMPEEHETTLWLCAAVFGPFIGAFLALAAARAATIWPQAKEALLLFPESEDKIWIAFGTLAAFILPFALRMLVLDDAPIADDESSYDFGAHLVASGHLTAPSPPMKLFYDRAFMINDGHLYPMNFMGWPILMAPGVWLGGAGYMNAFYFALTVPAMYIAAQELGGTNVARATLLLFVTAPMLLIAAATQMSNTTCFMALAWTFACWLRSRRDGAPIGWHVGVGLAFGLAVLIRPVSAVGIGIPMLLAWLVDALRGPRAELPRRLLALALPGAAALALFLAINKVQNGSMTKFSYARDFEYAKENGLRFTHWNAPRWRAEIEAGTLKPGFASRPFYQSIANAGAALLRLATAAFGWVPSFLFMPFAVKRVGLDKNALPITVLVTSFIGHFLVHFSVADLGIDTFGTHHYFEVTLPMVFLTALGVQACAQWIGDHVPSARVVPGALLAGLSLFALIGTTPPRVAALLDMARDVTMPRDMLAELKVKRAVVFSPEPFTSRMALCSIGAQHFVFWRPNNDPELKNDVLWVNHLDVAQDRKLMESFRDRRGIVYFFDAKCEPHMVPLDAPEADLIPPGKTGAEPVSPSVPRRGPADPRPSSPVQPPQ